MPRGAGLVDINHMYIMSSIISTSVSHATTVFTSSGLESVIIKFEKKVRKETMNPFPCTKKNNTPKINV